MLNLFWEKTPENVFYSALQKTIDDLELTLTDYTAVEDIHIPSKIHLSSNFGGETAATDGSRLIRMWIIQTPGFFEVPFLISFPRNVNLPV